MPEVGARQGDAEPEVGEDGRYIIRSREDLERLKTIERTKDNPPADVLPEEKPLWDEYVDYWHERIKKLERAFNRKLKLEASTESPDGLAEAFKEKLNLELSTEPPRNWESYKEVRTSGRSHEGKPYQKHILEVLKSENEDKVVEGDVGVIKEGRKPKKGRLKPTPKFADQLAVDKQELQAWVDTGRPEGQVPKIETYSNKSREFAAMLTSEGKIDKDKIEDWVSKDVREILNKYSGRLEIRRDVPGSELNVMRDFTAEVKKMYLVYDGRPDFVTPEVRLLIEKTVKRAANGNPVEVQIRQ